MTVFNDFNPKDFESRVKTLILEAIPGEKAKDDKGKTDARLFNVDVPLRAIMNPRTLMWNFKYDAGSVPGALQGEFTSFGKAVTHAEWYFKKRNIRIKEITEDE